MRHGLHHGIFLREAGRDRGARTVLWIHGLGESGLCFEPMIDHPRLADWRHVVPDLPGYGRTAWPRAPLGLIELVDLLADLMADLCGDPVVTVGHSMGGVLATALSERHPSLVRGLVDVDGNVTRGDCTFSGEAADQELEAFEARGFDALRDRVYEAGLEDRAQRGYYASLRQAQPATFHRHGVELVQWSEGRTLAARRAALECPRIYVAGAPGGACEESRRLLDQARMPVAEIAPSGHWPFIDQPARFVTVLESFLGNQT